MNLMFGKENRFEGESDYSSVATFYGPGYITTTDNITSWIEGMGTVDKTIDGDVHYHHGITPETEHSCHYFGTSSRTHRHSDLEFHAMFTPFEKAVRGQDVVAVEAIEVRMLQFGDPTVELMVKSDMAAGRVRRMMQKLIDQEQGFESAARSPELETE